CRCWFASSARGGTGGFHVTGSQGWPLLIWGGGRRELAAGPPLALAAIKRLMNSAFDAPVREGLDREATAQRRILASSDFIEAVAARVQKREPHFEAR